MRPKAPLIDVPSSIELLGTARLDAVVGTSAHMVLLISGHSTWLDEKLRGWMQIPGAGEHSHAGFAVLDTSGGSGLVTSRLFREAAQASSARIVRHPAADAHPTGREAADALLEVLDAMGLQDARLGIELDGAPPWLGSHLKERLPNAKLLDCSTLLRLCRMRKSDEAIRRIRKVARTTEEALTAALTVSATAGELADAFRIELAARKADFDHCVHGLATGGLSAVSSSHAWPAGPCFIDAGAKLEHFYSDTGLTVTADRRLSATQASRLARARETLSAGAAALSAGSRASGVFAAMADVARSDPALRVQGHGLGLDIRELPLIVPRRNGRDVIKDEAISVPGDLELSPQVVVNLEVAGFYDDGSIQLEETYLLTNNTPELLSAKRSTVRHV